MSHQIKWNKGTNKLIVSLPEKSIWETGAVPHYLQCGPGDSLPPLPDPDLCPSKWNLLKGSLALWFWMVSANWKNRQEISRYLFSCSCPARLQLVCCGFPRILVIIPSTCPSRLRDGKRVQHFPLRPSWNPPILLHKVLILTFSHVTSLSRP